MWGVVGDGGFCATTSWPLTKDKFEEKFIKMPIQVNGKTRSVIDVTSDQDKDIVLKKAMSDSKIIKNIQNKEVIKTIYVKNKIVNLVIK